MHWFLALIFALWPLVAGAQSDDDKGYLVQFLESRLSDAGRRVTIDGFAGALSSRATFDRLQIADAAGVWITIDKGAISWNRAALLSGRLEIAELSAADIQLARWPQTGGATFEAGTGFSLPDLPVSVSIGKISADRLTIGAPILGQEAQVSLSGAATLEGGAATATAEMARIDGAKGALSLDAAFDNATRTARIALSVSEGPNGIAATLLNLPDRPALDLSAQGDGPIDNFATKVTLATDGAPRLSGTVTTRQTADARQFALTLAGDVRPLLAPDFRAFFGDDLSLEAEGKHHDDGRIDLQRLVLEAGGVAVSGRLGLAGDRTPTTAALTVRLGLPDNSRVRLPSPGASTFARAGLLRLRFDRSRGPDWTIDGTLEGYRRGGTSVAMLSLAGQGKFLIDGGRSRFSGAADIAANGIEARDPALAQALGKSLSGHVGFDWAEGQPLALSDLNLVSDDAALTGDLSVTSDGLNPKLSGNVRLTTPDLRRFSALFGYPLAGASQVDLSGELSPLSGAFDVTATMENRDLDIGLPLADKLLKGASQLRLSALRDGAGLAIRSLDLESARLTVRAKGQLTSAGQTAKADLSLTEAADLLPVLSGPLALSATIGGPAAAPTVDARIKGAAGLDAQLTGTFARDFSAVDLAIAGAGDASILNERISPRSAAGQMRFDLILKGAPSVDRLTGHIDGRGLRIASPREQIAIIDTDLGADLSQGKMRLAGQGKLAAGGAFTVDGSLDLSGPFDAALRIALSRAHFKRTNQFSTIATGSLSLDGPLFSGALLGGDLTLEQTEIPVSQAAFGETTPPVIRHLAEPAEVRETRARAGYDDRPSASAAFLRLDLMVHAPSQVHVRGRGLDAELGGDMRLRGTTQDVRPEGRFDLLRGRLNLFGKRFTLSTGRVQLVGSLIPLIDFSASSDRFGVTTTITISGPVTQPEIHFASSSGVPEEEVISEMLFGTGLQKISAFQLAQLAGAIATLTGNGSDTVVTRLRTKFGLDDLDIVASDTGDAAVKAGKYLSPKLYSETSIDSQGKSTIDLTLDVTRDLSVKGAVGSDGTTGAGIFYSKDY